MQAGVTARAQIITVWRENTLVTNAATTATTTTVIRKQVYVCVII